MASILAKVRAMIRIRVMVRICSVILDLNGDLFCSSKLTVYFLNYFFSKHSALISFGMQQTVHLT